MSNKNKPFKKICSYTTFASFLNSPNKEQLDESETFFFLTMHLFLLFIYVTLSEDKTLRLNIELT